MFLCALSAFGRSRGVDRFAQTLDDRVQLAVLDDIGRREQNVIPALAVDSAATGIAHQATRHGLGPDPGEDLAFRMEGLAARPIGDQLDADEQARPRISPT